MLGSTREDAFKTDDLTLLNQVAAQLAIAIENARTAREVEQLRVRLNQRSVSWRANRVPSFILKKSSGKLRFSSRFSIRLRLSRPAMPRF